MGIAVHLGGRVAKPQSRKELSRFSRHGWGGMGRALRDAMRFPQFSTVMVWLLAGVVSANVAAAEPGRGSGQGAARGPWFHKLDRSLQRAVDAGDSGQGGGRRRVIIRTRAGVSLRGSAAFDQLAEKPQDFALSLVGGV